MVGKEELSYEPLVVGESNAESYVTGDLTAEDRRLPILAVSEYFTGGYAINPMDAQKTLAGVARVVCYTKEANKRLGSMLNSRVHCFNGAVRVLWPGCRQDVNGDGPKSIFRFPTDAKREEADLLLDMREVCVWVAMASGFEEQFSKAKIRVFQERIRLSQESGETIDKLNQHISNLNARISAVETERDRYKEVSEKRAEEIGSLETELEDSEDKREQLQRDLVTSQVRIEELQQDFKVAHDEITRLRKFEESTNQHEDIENLRKENKELLNTKRTLENENGCLIERIHLLESGEGNYSISLTDPIVDNVTILNHAINIFRNPMREHLIEQLKRKDLRKMKEAAAQPDDLNVHEPETFFDILDITGENDRYDKIKTFRFGDVASTYLDWVDYQFFADIQELRNNAAHPRYDGLPTEDVKRGMRSIADALNSIGKLEKAATVDKLAELVR